MAADTSYQPGLQRRQDGTAAVSSGSSLDIESGASLKLAGTAITASAAELNILTGVTATAAELNKLDNVTTTTAELNILTGVTATAAELNKCAGIAAAAYPVVAVEATFTETTGAGTYTGSVIVPAGATILDIKVRSTVLWDTADSAAMDVGDVTDPNGWFAGIDLKATDLLVGEEINFVQTGGKEGAYLSTTTGARTAAYSGSARTVSGLIAAVGATGSAGRTRMLVVYAVPTATAATKA